MMYLGVVLLVLVFVLYGYWIWLIGHGTAENAVEEKGVQKFNVRVKGVYRPNVLQVKVNQPVQITFTREEDVGCSRFVVFSDFNIRKELPEGERVLIEFTPDKKGEFTFTCDMGMYQGKLIVV